MTVWTRFYVIALGTVLGPLDSAVNVAFPAITGAFGVPQAAIQWVVVCYVISYAMFLLIFGRVGDLFGHLRVFQAGLVICALSFLGSGMAETFEWLMATRVLQGIGTAMVLSCGPALATRLFDDSQRIRALGGYAAVIGLGTAIGPSLGGACVALWGWSSVFWFRLPIALLALVLSMGLAMPAQLRAAGKFDVSGAFGLALALGSPLVAISRSRNGDMGLVEIAAYVGVTLVGAIFMRFGRRGDGDAVVAFSMFRNPNLSLITLTGIAVNLVGFAVMLFVPYYLTRVAQLPMATGGLVLAVSPVGMIIAGHLGPRLCTRFGAKLMGLAGALLVALGTGLVGLWGSDSAMAELAAASLVHGLGLGLYQVAQLDVSTASLPRESRGVAGSLVMLTRTLGVVAAASLLTAIFVAFETGNASASAPDFLSAFQMTFRIAALGLAVFLAATLLYPKSWFAPIRSETS